MCIRDRARAAILEKYPWNMTVVFGEDSYEVTNLMASRIDSLLTEIYSGEPQETYSLDTTCL